MLICNSVEGMYEPWSSQTEDYKINICCFSTRYAALSSNGKDGLESG